MINKGLLIAVGCLAVLGGLVWWSNTAQTKKAAAPAPDAPPKILTVPDDQIRVLKLTKAGAEPTVLTRANNVWTITAPQPLPADQDAVSQVVSSLSNLTADRVIEEKAGDLKPYGLAAPAETVAFTKKDGKTQTLLLGDDSPTKSGAYAKLVGDPRVFTIGSFVKSGLDKGPKDLRDKRLLTFNSDKLTRVEVTAKGQSFEFGKNAQNEWQIVKPKPMRADGPQVDELVRKLKDAKLDTGVSEEDAKKAQTAFAGGTKIATVTTTDASGSQTLEVRKDKDKNYYAKSSAVAGVYKSTADLGDGLDKSADDFRNKKLFDFGFSDPTQVEIGSTVFKKSGEKWTSGSTAMDANSVQGVVDKLRDLAATKFPDKASGEQYLLLSATSNDGKRVERVNLTKAGDSLFATREGEAGVYQLDPKAVDELQKAAAAVKPASTKPSSTKPPGKK